MADELIPYIKFNPKLGDYQTIELNSLPFPSSHLPEIFNLHIFFIEQNKYGHFLRSSINSLFCCELYEIEKEIEMPEWDAVQGSYRYNEQGEIICKNERLQYLCFTTEGEERTVAYNYAGKGKCYLQMHQCEVPFENLDEKLQKLYLGAKLLSKQYITHFENEIRMRDFKITGLKPKGEWEAEMFRDVFNSNPNTMSDEEYEMIFGVER